MLLQGIRLLYEQGRCVSSAFTAQARTHRFSKLRQVQFTPVTPARMPYTDVSYYQAALRYELGDHHTFDFAEGTVSTSIAPELRDNFTIGDDFFAYADFRDSASCIKALDQLESYVAAEGPFDGVLAFSQGAALAVAYLAQRWALDPAEERVAPVFKCAILFSARDACKATMERLSEILPAGSQPQAGFIQIPTAHIWGREDDEVDGLEVAKLFTPASREVYVHDGGHEVPGARMTAAVKSVVLTIRRVVTSVSHNQM